MSRKLALCVLGILSLSFVGCGGSSEHQDLLDFIQETKERPAGKIPGIPSFRPYEAFIYNSASLRSPFDKPLDVKRRVFAQSSQNVKPDFNRAKEYLERFDFGALSMVGTIEKSGVLWALIVDDAGEIHRVTVGNYVGKNHGRIIAATESKLDIVEIVSDGLEGWLERPRVLALKEKE